MRLLLVVAALILVPATALAKAPRTGAIVPGVGIGGVKLGQFAKVVNRADGSQVVRGHKTRSFGRVHQFCLEGDLCAWKVRGGGFLTLDLNQIAHRVTGLSTNARGYVTPEGIHRGSTTDKVVAAYPGAKSGTRCIGPAGAEVSGYIVRSHGNVTIFATDQFNYKVTRIHVVDRAPRCR